MRLSIVTWLLLTSGLLCGPVAGDNATNTTDKEQAADKASAADAAPADLVPLNSQKTVLLDTQRKRLLLKTTVAQREALLEMFLCKQGTKEHETVLAIDSEAYVIHAGLLAIGAQPGKPVQYTPEYKPPSGQIIDVFVTWNDENGRPHRERAQKWVRHVTRRYYVAPLKQLPEGFTMPDETELRYDPKRGELIWFGQMSEAERDRHLAISDDKAYQQAIKMFYNEGQSKQMDADFVFAGSGFHEEESGERYYLAETGNIICVANFSEATIDIAIRSTAENSDLMFEPWTERIPELGTEVTVELVPRPDKQDAPKETKPAETGS